MKAAIVLVLAGITFGPLGAVVAAWPALALVGSYELLMLIIRGSAAAVEEPAPEPPVPADINEAVRLAHMAGIAAGEPVSQRQLADRFGVSRRQVGRILAQSNGHHPEEEETV